MGWDWRTARCRRFIGSKGKGMPRHIARHGVAIDRDAPTCPAGPESELTEGAGEKAEQEGEVAAGRASANVCGWRLRSCCAARENKLTILARNFCSIRSDREFRNLPGRQGDDFFRLRGSFHDQWHAQILFQEMLTCGKARGGLYIIAQAGNTQYDSICRFFSAETRAARDTALAKRARQTQDAGQGADAALLLRRKLGKRTDLRAGFGAAMVTDRKSEQLPIFAAPTRRNGQTKKEFARGFLGRLVGIRIANAMQASRSKQHATNTHVGECGCGMRPLKSVEEGDRHP